MSVAPIIIMKERRVVERFQEAGAVGPESARPLAELSVGEGLALRRLRRRAVIREAYAGAFYLDEASWNALLGVRRRLVATLLVVGAAIGAGLYLARPGG